MGCTDERSVSSKTKQKRGRSFSNTDGNPKGDKKIEKRNSINEDDQKEFSKSQKPDQSIKAIQFNNNNNINNNKINNNEDLKESKDIEDEDNNDEDEDNAVDEDEVNNENNIEEEDKSGTDEFEEDEIDPDVPEMNREIYREIAPYLQSRVNPNFNFPEVKEEKYVGGGLRRMKAFISNISKEELQQRREAFWGTRVEGNEQIWQFLKEICELPPSEDENIKPMLEANEITPLKNCINVTFDRGGEVYEIPNYCINEPIKYDLPESHLKRPEKKKIGFHGRKGAEQFKIKTENYTKVESIRKNIGKKFNKSEKNIRLFFRGKEMKDGHELWQYNVQDDDVIIIMCSG